MLQSGGAWSGVRAMEMLRPHRPAARPPARRRRCSRERLGLGDCGRTPYRRLCRRAAAAARAGDGARRAARSWSSSTSRPPAWTRRPGATRGSCSRSCARDGVTVVLTTHYMDEAERLADRIHIIDHGRLIASGSPLELTRGGTSATIRLVVTRPFPPGAPESLRATLGDRDRGHPARRGEPAGHRPGRRAPRWPRCRRWCEENGVLPESLTLGQRTLEDVFLQLTGRELAP